MSDDNSDYQLLKGEIAALKHVLAAGIRAAQPDPTGRSSVPLDVIGVVIRNIDSEIKGGQSAHVPNTIPGQTEFRRGYTDMLKEIKQAICGPQTRHRS